MRKSFSWRARRSWGSVISRSCRNTMMQATGSTLTSFFEEGEATVKGY